MSLSLVVLAAGIGSRFGGLKQMTPMGPSGEFIIDYSVYDALRAGFDRVVFVIRSDIETDFRATIGARVERVVDTGYVLQSLDDLPGDRRPPPGRTKPWGTGQAALAAAEAVDGPFAVINADDFYGADAYARLATFLRESSDAPSAYAMVGYVLERTLSEHGHVSRGICDYGDDGMLRGVRECTHIERTADGIVGGDAPLTGQEIVSMNCWGFKPAFMSALGEAFEAFLEDQDGELKSEFYLPAVVSDLVQEGCASCRVLETPGSWFGVTHAEETEPVRAAIRDLVDRGVYPTPLWDTGE